MSQRAALVLGLSARFGVVDHPGEAQLGETSGDGCGDGYGEESLDYRTHWHFPSSQTEQDGGHCTKTSQGAAGQVWAGSDVRAITAKGMQLRRSSRVSAARWFIFASRFAWPHGGQR